MNKNNKNVVSEALVEYDKLMSTMKEGTQTTIKNLLKEEIHKALNECVLKEDEEEFEVEDDTIEDTDTTDTETTPEVDLDAIEMDVEVDSTEEMDDDIKGDEWSEFEKYKVGEDEYDFSAVEDDEVIVKVYKAMKDNDSVHVVQTGDVITLNDEETGADYVIKVNGEDAFNFEKGKTEEDEEIFFEIDLSKLTKNSLKESMDNLGYTDDYQHEDSIEGLSMTEPANPKSTREVNKGIPTGTEKPWAGHDKGTPFDEVVTEDIEVEAYSEGEGEIDEIVTGTLGNARRASKTMVSTVREPHLPTGSRNISSGGEFQSRTVKESVEYQALLKENIEIKNVLAKVNKLVTEANLTNINLGKIIKLVTENTTTKDEKKEIILRFANEAKTPEQSNALYESIKREINSKTVTNPMVVLEKSMTTTGSSQINETTVYESTEVKKIKDMMKFLN